MDIIYGKEKMLPRVAEAEALESYNLLLTFNNGERRVFDAGELMKMPEYSKICDVFKDFKVAYGTVVWPGEIDVSPDKLYLNSVPQNGYPLRKEEDLPGKVAETVINDDK